MSTHTPEHEPVTDTSSDRRPVQIRDQVLTLVRFHNERDKTPRPWTGTLPELLGSQHQIRANKKGTEAFSAVTYIEGSTRGKRGVVEATAMVLDFDHLTSEAADQVSAALQGKAFAGYTSFSHCVSGEDDRCFRVILLCDRPIRPDEYDDVWIAANEELGGFADPSARDISRLWFLPACPSERSAQARIHYFDGEPIDVDLYRNLGALSEDSATGRKKRRKKKRASRLGDSDGGEESSSGPVGHGRRNSHLTSLAGTMRRRGLSEDAIAAALRIENAANCDPPLSDEQINKVAHSVCNYPPASPLVTLRCSDMGNAERLAHHAGQDLRYVYPWDSWLRWDGRAWRRDESGEIVRRARDTMRALDTATLNVNDKDTREYLEQHALRGESASRLNAMIQLARSLLPVGPGELDRHPSLLTCDNGTVDLRTGKLGRHDRRHLITKVAPVDYEPDAACPRWEAFLDRVMAGDRELVTFLQRAVGYSLTGSTGEQVLFLLHGVGANGKSTFVETVRALLGDYATQADFTTFLRREGESVRNDIARLAGARFVAAVEADAGKALAESVVKQLTGGDTITARFLFREYFEFVPAFKVWLAANHKPSIRGVDHGIWRRIRLVPFTVTIPEAERDPQLTLKLRRELPGILAWAVRGCLAWREHGLAAPAGVVDATATYREEMDVLGGFLEECGVASHRARVKAKDLYTAYTAWCEANGERPISQKVMGQRLQDRGFQRFKGSRGVRCWRGLGLRSEADDAQL